MNNRPRDVEHFPDESIPDIDNASNDAHLSRLFRLYHLYWMSSIESLMQILMGSWLIYMWMGMILWRSFPDDGVQVGKEGLSQYQVVRP